MKQPFSVKILTIVAAVAGLLYCSWPLGYILNPVANRGLASNLEAVGQPYNWLFTALDIISGVLICWVAFRLYMNIRRRSWLILLALFGFGLFGLLTAVDAVLPINCIAPAQSCPPVLHDRYFIIHGIASIGSTNGLTLSIVALWWLLVRSKGTPSIVRYTLHAIILIWFGFGIGTGALILLDRSSVLSQHVFIVVCSLWSAALPYLLYMAAKTKRPQSISRRLKPIYATNAIAKHSVK